MRIFRHPLAGLSAKLVIVAIACAAGAEGTTQQRPFRVDDLFEMEDVGRYFGGPVAFSADGLRLAFTRVRPKKTASNHKWDGLRGNARGDVWVQLESQDDPVNITNGIEDSSGWWSPQWSPDASKLAMLSTRGGNIRLWIWDLRTRQLRQLTNHAVSFDAPGQPYVWLDSKRLLFAALPGDERPLVMDRELLTPAIASAAWAKVPEGRQATVSVLKSGLPLDLSKRPQGQLLLVDVSGTEKVVVNGATRYWQLSPNRKAVAFARQTGVTPGPGEPLARTFSGVWTIDVVSLDGRPIEVRGGISRDVNEKSLRWSPDGSELAFLSYGDSRKAPPVLSRLDARSGAVSSHPLTKLDAASFVRGARVQLNWKAEGELLVRAAKRREDDHSEVTVRNDYWLVSKNGAHKSVTKLIPNPPPEIWPQDGRRRFIGLGDGDVWRITPATVEVENLTASFEPEIEHLSWPAQPRTGIEEPPRLDQTYSQIIFSAREDTGLVPHLLDLHTLAIRLIRRPDPAADLVAYAQETDTGIFHASDRNGLFMWRSSIETGVSQKLIDANGFLRAIAQAEFKRIEYTSLDGESLNAWLILPVGYESGNRYPLLTWVYAGWVASWTPSGHWGIDSSNIFNPQIPAACGYVVLMPSMPLAPEGGADDPMLRLPDGVLPAVDQAIDLGIADAERLFLMGYSFGGFSTYGLVSQTRRFKAAVSIAGASNLISLYGQLDATLRYTEHPHESFPLIALVESGLFRMGNPPWKDLGRYVRNSPIFSVDRVLTPLMIIQGDLDFVAMQQGEEFFMSLARQGKRAEFVRYWGEGHSLESPANIRDMWRRIFDWYDSSTSLRPYPPNALGKCID